MNDANAPRVSTDALHPGTVRNVLMDLVSQRAMVSPHDLETTLKQRTSREIVVEQSKDGLMYIVSLPGSKHGTALPQEIYNPWDSGQSGWHVQAYLRKDRTIIDIEPDGLPWAEWTSQGWVPLNP